MDENEPGYSHEAWRLRRTVELMNEMASEGHDVSLRLGEYEGEYYVSAHFLLGERIDEWLARAKQVDPDAFATEQRRIYFCLIEPGHVAHDRFYGGGFVTKPGAKC